jgi:hypothetical protein
MTRDFQSRIQDPHAWFIFAELSFRGAEALWQISDAGRAFSSEVPFGRASLEEAKKIGNAVRMSIPSLLLAGFGFESLLKGILLRQMNFRGEPTTTIRKGKAFLVGSLKSHDLLGLATRAGVSLDAEEVRMLERLSTIVMWAGRYPVSVGEEGLVPGAGEYRPNDGEIVIALMGKIFRHANETPELIRLGPAGERVETVQLPSGQWRVQLLSDGTVQREAVWKESIEAYQAGLDWGRELDHSARKP